MTKLIEPTESSESSESSGLESLEAGDVIEFVYPETSKGESGKFGVGRFIRTIQRRKGGKAVDIELTSALKEKIIIQENNIRWERTLFHKNKT